MYVSTGSVYANYTALTPWALAASRCTWPRIPWCLTGSARCPACTAHSRYSPLASCRWWAAPSRYSPLAAYHWWAGPSRYSPLATCHWWAAPSCYSPLLACYWWVARQLTARRVAGPSQLCSPTFLHNRKGLQRFNVNKSLAGRLPLPAEPLLICWPPRVKSITGSRYTFLLTNTEQLLLISCPPHVQQLPVLYSCCWSAENLMSNNYLYCTAAVDQLITSCLTTTCTVQLLLISWSPHVQQLPVLYSCCWSADHLMSNNYLYCTAAADQLTTSCPTTSCTVQLLLISWPPRVPQPYLYCTAAADQLTTSCPTTTCTVQLLLISWPPRVQNGRLQICYFPHFRFCLLLKYDKLQYIWCVRGVSVRQCTIRVPLPKLMYLLIYLLQNLLTYLLRYLLTCCISWPTSCGGTATKVISDMQLNLISYKHHKATNVMMRQTS